MRGGKEHVAVQDVVGDVGDQKGAGDNEGREHAVAVCGDSAELDVAEAGDEEDGAECVEYGVERGEKCQVGAGGVDGWVVVDQPGEEDRCDRADADDGGDDRGGCSIVWVGSGKGGHGVPDEPIGSSLLWMRGQNNRRPFASSIMASRSKGR